MILSEGKERKKHRKLKYFFWFYIPKQCLTNWYIPRMNQYEKRILIKQRTNTIKNQKPSKILSKTSNPPSSLLIVSFFFSSASTLLTTSSTKKIAIKKTKTVIMLIAIFSDAYTTQAVLKSMHQQNVLTLGIATITL